MSPLWEHSATESNNKNSPVFFYTAPAYRVERRSIAHPVSPARCILLLLSSRNHHNVHIAHQAQYNKNSSDHVVGSVIHQCNERSIPTDSHRV